MTAVYAHSSVLEHVSTVFAAAVQKAQYIVNLHATSRCHTEQE